MLALQEELDFTCYRLYGLWPAGVPLPICPEDKLDDLPGVQLGERAFEIVLARRVKAGEAETAWFNRHRSTPITEVPTRWPQWYREIVEARIAAIEEHRFIKLIEDPEFKRRWAEEPWEEREKKALHGWLLDRLETARYWPAADRDDEEAI